MGGVCNGTHLSSSYIKNTISREQSVIWQKVLMALWTEKITKKEIADRLHVPQKEIENVLFGLANMLSNSDSGRPARNQDGLKLIS
jgi:ribosomal protein L22